LLRAAAVIQSVAMSSQESSFDPKNLDISFAAKMKIGMFLASAIVVVVSLASFASSVSFSKVQASVSRW